jgi:hypothetical protein
MRHAQRDPAHALRAVSAPGRDLLRLRHGLNHRHHDARSTRVEHGSDEVIVAARHTHHRYDPEAAGRGDLRFDGFDANSAVLGIEQRKSAPASANIAIRPGEKNSKAIVP